MAKTLSQGLRPPRWYRTSVDPYTGPLSTSKILRPIALSTNPAGEVLGESAGEANVAFSTGLSSKWDAETLGSDITSNGR